MYVRKVKIENIRNISSLELKFSELPGWHILIGDNGAGKTTILRTIAMGLIGPGEVLRLDPDWESWVRKGALKATIEASIVLEDRPELPPVIAVKNEKHITIKIEKNTNTSAFQITNLGAKLEEGSYPSHKGKKFAAGFGAFRRFSGGDPLLDKDLEKVTPITPYQTLFREGVALTSTLAWIKDLYARSHEKNGTAHQVLEGIRALVSSGGLLPGQLKVEKITADGVFFIDAEKKVLHLNDLSDGIKSVLALTFELLRLILQVYPEIFEPFSPEQQLPIEQSSSEVVFPVSGVVLIDEIDAHLHPTWQTRIGQWFTHYFPNIQFIVTTHSPLICRAATKGSIWRLAAPGSHFETYEVRGAELNRLIYGNVLEAFGTEAFGQNVERSKEGQEKLEKLAELETMNTFGKLNEKEKQELRQLQQTFTSDDRIDL